ncbi:MAG: (Fe-S)-binding protein [Bacillota bacterium]
MQGFDFKDWEKEAVKCIRCGACQTVCPVYQHLKAESTVARGKVRLIRAAIKDQIPLTEGFAQRMSWCLNCKACINACPSGVKTDRLVEAARTELARRRGLTPVEKAAFRGLLKNSRLLHLVLRAASGIQGLFFRPGPGGNGVLPKLPVGLDSRRLVQPLARTSFRSRPVKMAPAKTKGKVAFFTGCLINYGYPQVGQAVVEVLAKNGYQVVLPPQHCCGTPVRVGGDRETAVEIAKFNLDALADLQVEAVITACASCGLALKNTYQDLAAELPLYQKKALRLGGMVKDISEFIAGLPGWQEGMGHLPSRVTYHDPCHLARGMGISRPPREILQGIPGMSLVEMAKPDRCCGGAGSFSLIHYSLSLDIGREKALDIRQTGAAVVAAGCPGCMMHINDALYQSGVPAQVRHPAELLAEAYRAGLREKKGTEAG